MSSLVDRFIEYFENHRTDPNGFNFSCFFQNELTTKSPSFRFINYDSDEESFMSQVKECILTNLEKNSKFVNDYGYQTKSVEKIYQIFKKTKNTRSDHDNAQLIFLLAFSKVKVDPDYFESIFILFDSIEIVKEQGRLDIINELDRFHKHLITISEVHDLIVRVCDEILGMRISEINLSDVLLEYFTAAIIGLNGFSGRDVIYINQSQIKKLAFVIDSQRYSFEDKLVILKLNFFRLFIHEATHLVIRKCSKNFNNVTPELLTESQKKQYSKSEAGLIMESKVFNDHIDWQESVKNPKFNLIYCRVFYDDLMDGKIEKFDPKIAQTITRESLLTECDFYIKKSLIFE